nr:immunoglobulin heavy chain junction region [Mus musculus]
CARGGWLPYFDYW